VAQMEEVQVLVASIADLLARSVAETVVVVAPAVAAVAVSVASRRVAAGATMKRECCLLSARDKAHTRRTRPTITWARVQVMLIW